MVIGNGIYIGGSGNGGDYVRLNIYDGSGSKLVKTEYIEYGGSYTSQIPLLDEIDGSLVDLSNITNSCDLYYPYVDNAYLSDDGSVDLIHYDDYDVWFFNGCRIDSNLKSIDLDAKLQQFSPGTNVWTIMAKAYSDKSSNTYIGNISCGYYYDGFRLLSTNNTTYLNDVIWAVLEVPNKTAVVNTVNGGQVQQSTYISIFDYLYNN